MTIFFRLKAFLRSEVALCAAAIVLMSFVFVVIYRTSFWLVACSMPLAILAGYVMLFLERRAVELHWKVMARSGRTLAGFLAFFIFLLLGILVFLTILSYPMGAAAERLGVGNLGVHYGRWSVNLGIVVSLGYWLRCIIDRLSDSQG